MANHHRRADKELVQQILIDDPEFLRRIVERTLQQLLEAEITEHIGAAPYERTQNRKGHRNGYKPRKLKTRVGTLDLLVPQDREGTFSTQLFARYQRNEKALVLALMQMYVEGVSTRKVREVTEELCGTSFSKSLLSELAANLDSELEEWRSRPKNLSRSLAVCAPPGTLRTWKRPRGSRCVRSPAATRPSLSEEIAELDAQLERLVAQAAPELVRLLGVGTNHAATLLVLAGDNPDRLKSEASFASLCGVSPLEASSGKVVRHRLNRGGNRDANRALHMICVVRMGSDRRSKIYVSRRLAEGKSKWEIMRCLKRYIAREIYRILLSSVALRTSPSGTTNHVVEAQIM